MRASNTRFSAGSLRLVEANCEAMPFPDGRALHNMCESRQRRCPVREEAPGFRPGPSERGKSTPLGLSGIVLEVMTMHLTILMWRS